MRVGLPPAPPCTGHRAISASPAWAHCSVLYTTALTGGKAIYPHAEIHVHIRVHVCTCTLIILSQDLASTLPTAPLPKQWLLSVFYSCITASSSSHCVQAFGFKLNLWSIFSQKQAEVPPSLESLKIHMELHFQANNTSILGQCHTVLPNKQMDKTLANLGGLLIFH